MYVLAKFQLCILKAFEVTAPQSSSNRKIDLFNKYLGNRLLALTKTNVTYKCSDALTQKFHHRVHHDLRNKLLGKLFLLLLFVITNKVEIHEETSIVSNHFDIMCLAAITYNSFGALHTLLLVMEGAKG